MSSLIPIVLILIICFALFAYCRYTVKFPKFGTVSIITGAVKTGKTTLAVHCALKAYRKAVIFWHIRRGWCRFTRKPLPEKPLLYSNIPLSVPHVRLTMDQLLRQKRFNYKSVLLLSEFALVADSQMIRDKDINNDLLLLFKLFGHETHGGSMFLDTQQIQDCHYACKRVCNSYLYIDRTIKLPIIPFLIMKVIENRYSEDGTVVAVDTDDIANRTKTLIIPKRVWKKFDTYTYSVLTDDLDTEDVIIRDCHDLKTRNILTFDPERLLSAKRLERKAQYGKACLEIAPATHSCDTVKGGAVCQSATESLPSADTSLNGKERS